MIFVCFFTHTPYKPSGNWDEAAAGGISLQSAAFRFNLRTQIHADTHSQRYYEIECQHKYNRNVKSPKIYTHSLAVAVIDLHFLSVSQCRVKPHIHR